MAEYDDIPRRGLPEQELNNRLNRVETMINYLLDNINNLEYKIETNIKLLENIVEIIKLK
jgi:hypothetical protein